MKPVWPPVPLMIFPLVFRLTGTILLRSAASQSAFRGARKLPLSGSTLSKRAMATALPT
jgi:hypothetical protein